MTELEQQYINHIKSMKNLTGFAFIKSELKRLALKAQIQSIFESNNVKVI